MDTLIVRSRARCELIDITAEVQRLVAARGLPDGLCVLYVPHTTAGVLVNEGADPAVAADILATLERLVPRHGPYRHAEGNADAHIKAALVGTALQVPVAGGRLALGTWQAIFFAEFDGPRQRQMCVEVRPAAR
ncbi:MAG: YjbQ family protein [Chloroflexi bacterium]|nr:YjbQ family protein [Chloroflexota bacterium]